VTNLSLEDFTECSLCRTKISTFAKICSVCGSHQNEKVRSLRKIVAFFSAASVILGVLVLAVSNFPSAVKTIFPKNEVDIYSIETISAGKSTEVTFVNSGNTDIFLSKVTYEVPGITNKIGSYSQLVNRWLKPKELFTFRTHKRTVNDQVTYSQIVGPKRVMEIDSEENEKKIKYCYGLAYLSSDINEVPIIHKKIDEVDVHATIKFSSSDGSISEFKSKKKISGLIGVRKGCK